MVCLLYRYLLGPAPQEHPPLYEWQLHVGKPRVAREGELGLAPSTPISILILEGVGVTAVGAEDITAKDDLTQILTYLGFTWNLVECVHIHIVTSWSGLVPTGLDYPTQAP